MIQNLKYDRGYGKSIDLVWSSTATIPTISTITVEYYIKWYSLFLVRPTGLIDVIPFSDLEKYAKGSETAYGDHVPNPDIVKVLSVDCDYDIDPIAMEMMIGRWQIEHLGH